MKAAENGAPACPCCGGRGVLGQRGILRVYLWPCKLAVLLLVAGLILAAIFGRWLLLLAAGGFLLPLVNADLRLLLYPFVAVAALAGKPVNCPRCEPTGGIFRHR